MLESLRTLAVVALIGAGSANGQDYAGPKALGPFRIDKDVSMKSLFERLGPPSSTAGDVFCYQSKDGKTFLVLTRMVPVYDAKVAGDVLLSDFQNCRDKPVYVARDDLVAWKTEDGIGLRATEQEVLKAYGKPSSVYRIDASDYAWIIHGYRPNSADRPDLGDKVFLFTGLPDDLSAAKFGIRRGKVAWILLSKNE